LDIIAITAGHRVRSGGLILQQIADSFEEQIRQRSVSGSRRCVPLSSVSLLNFDDHGEIVFLTLDEMTVDSFNENLATESHQHP
jgi:hypothetical protein